MSDIDFDALRALADAATKGPWEVEKRDDDWSSVDVPDGDDTMQLAWHEGHGITAMRTEDAEFIAASREAVEVLLKMRDDILARHKPVTGNPDRDRPGCEATWCAQGCDAWPCADARACGVTP